MLSLAILFFSITYHAGYEWGRRYSNEKQRAIGIVRRDGEGTKVYCIRLAGMTNPISLIGVYLFCLWIYYIKDGVAFALGDGLWLSLIVTTIVAGTTAFFNSVTEQGQEAYNIVSAYLIDPSDYWSLLR